MAFISSTFFLALSSLVVVLASVDLVQEPITSLTLEGSLLRDCQADPINCKPIAIQGPNVSIFHGDGTCSFLFVNCGLDGMTVTLKSPGHVTEAYLTWLGTKQPYQERPKECTGFRSSSVQTEHQRTYSKKASYIPPQSDVCGTEIATVGHDEFMTNVVNVVEFLQQEPLRDPNVLLLSHTHVTVKCCNVVAQDPVTCSAESVKESGTGEDLLLVDCDDKKFELDCSENTEDEFYECKLKLNKDQILGDPRLRYSIHSCEAAVAGSTVPLITYDSTSGPQSNADLEVSPVCVSDPNAEASRLEYHFKSPYFQFADQPSGALGAHDVMISCSVEVYESSSRPDANSPACGFRSEKF